MPEIDEGPTSGPKTVGLRIQDLIGLVFGYGLATLLVRTFGGKLDALSTEEFIALVLLYVWLGLVMSGPLILLLDRRGPAEPSQIPTTHPPSRYSGEELAWLGIGVYFIALTLLIGSAQLHRKTPWFLMLVVQVIVVVALFAWLMVDRQKRARNPPSRPRWTRRAAGVILLTWPVAWILLVLLLR
jgi:hypothetical protein